MSYIIIALKLIVAISLLNVWLIQKDKPTKWRGGNAQNIKEEFKVYGLPVWLCYLVGTLKVAGAIGLIVSIWVFSLERPSALILAALLTGSILMHFKIQDPLYKSFPAFLFLLMCLAVAFSGFIVL
ncbi:DoxX family protein [Psychroserpens burtonensis]|uniref:DoxX family protein n=1 Tax=Psychroserpens burtonensis TaxID=49278 RepID=A0A5C7BB67_9FLAO|nr:DoxX family protein [Psychroserpens burtonensis]TXE20293.1 DoxX family protein [Psychroserpens burtonensis]